MANDSLFEKRDGDDDVTRTILWPFFWAPLLFTGLVHVGTRIHWLLGGPH